MAATLNPSGRHQIPEKPRPNVFYLAKKEQSYGCLEATAVFSLLFGGLAPWLVGAPRENREKRGCASGNAAPTSRRLIGRRAHPIPLHFPARQKSCRSRNSFGSRLAHRGGTRCPDIANGVLLRKRQNDRTSSLQLSMIYASSLLFSCDGMITPLSLVSLLARIHKYQHETPSNE